MENTQTSKPTMYLSNNNQIVMKAIRKCSFYDTTRFDSVIVIKGEHKSN